MTHDEMIAHGATARAWRAEATALALRIGRAPRALERRPPELASDRSARALRRQAHASC